MNQRAITRPTTAVTEDPLQTPRDSVIELSMADRPVESAEHILIEDEHGDDYVEPRNIASQVSIRNALLGRRSEVTLYREGFVRLREGSAKRVLKDHVCELRFLDANFDTHRAIAKPWGVTALGAALLALLATLTGLAAAAAWTVLVTVALAVMALVGGVQFARRSLVEYVFLTSTGRTPVLRLTGNLGCLRQARSAAIDIQTAVSAAATPGLAATADNVRQLRAEMRAHYRLRDRGVISAEACSAGTAEILQHFG